MEFAVEFAVSVEFTRRVELAVVSEIRRPGGAVVEFADDC